MRFIAMVVATSYFAASWANASSSMCANPAEYQDKTFSVECRLHQVKSTWTADDRSRIARECLNFNYSTSWGEVGDTDVTADVAECKLGNALIDQRQGFDPWCEGLGGNVAIYNCSFLAAMQPFQFDGTCETCTALTPTKVMQTMNVFSHCCGASGHSCTPFTGHFTDTSYNTLDSSKTCNTAQTTCGDIRKAYKSQGCCGNPSAIFSLPNRRLAPLDDTESMLDRVRSLMARAELQGGAKSKLLAVHIRKALDSFMKDLEM